MCVLKRIISSLFEQTDKNLWKILFNLRELELIVI